MTWPEAFAVACGLLVVGWMWSSLVNAIVRAGQIHEEESDAP